MKHILTVVGFLGIGLLGGWLIWGMSSHTMNGTHQMSDGSMMNNDGSNMQAMMHDMNAELVGKTGNEFDKAFLEQMIIQGYLGKWINTTSPNIQPSETTAPLDQVIEFHPPLWLQEEFSNLKRKNDTSVALPKVFRALTNEEFNEVIRKSGLTIREFAEKLGVSRQTVSYLRSGKKKVSNELTAKIWLTFPEFFTQA